MNLLAIVLFSSAVLGTQVVWSRIFSFVLWYNFAFLVISIALLGFTAGGLLLQLRPSLLGGSRTRVLALSALGFSAATAAGLLAVVRLGLTGNILESASNVARFVSLIVIVGFGYFWAGLFVSLAIASEVRRAARIYFANMAGSGAGCALAVILLDALPPTAALLAFAVLAALSAVALLPGLERRRGPAVLGAGVLALVALALSSALDPLAEPFYMQSAKDFPALQKAQIRSRASNSFATVDFFEPGPLTGLWGLSDQHFRAEHPGVGLPDRIGICIDGWALTFAYSADADITGHPVFDFLPAALAYKVAAPERVLVIGAGGGIDVICALRNGAREITAVDVNPIIIEAGRGSLAAFNQDLFRRPGVHPVVAEGRGYLASAGERTWDLIQLSGVDTLAAGQAGAFALSENYLYTREAFTSYLNRLSPGGVLTLTRWLYNPPRQTLRVITIAAEALRSLGVRDPSKHIVAVADARWNYSVFLISREPLLPEHTARVLTACRAFGFVPLALPHVAVGTPGGNPFQDLLRTPDPVAFIASYPFDISVTTDDKPFFMEHTRWRNVLQYSDAIFNRASGRLLLLVTLGIVAALALVFVLIPLVVANRRARGGATNSGVLGYFACLGLGYVLVEIVLVQKFTLYLGNPSYSLSLVLCAMLTFSGLGSLASARLYDRGVRATSLVCVGIALTLAAYASFADPMLGATLGAGLPARVAITLLLLAVPGFLMGMPFPLGVRRLGEGQRDRVVGGWVVNGYCSVLGSCLALVVSISGGFRVVLLAGAAAYFLAAALAGRTAVAPGAAVPLPADDGGSPRA